MDSPVASVGTAFRGCSRGSAGGQGLAMAAEVGGDSPDWRSPAATATRLRRRRSAGRAVVCPVHHHVDGRGLPASGGQREVEPLRLVCVTCPGRLSPDCSPCGVRCCSKTTDANRGRCRDHPFVSPRTRRTDRSPCCASRRGAADPEIRAGLWDGASAGRCGAAGRVSQTDGSESRPILLSLGRHCTCGITAAGLLQIGHNGTDDERQRLHPNRRAIPSAAVR